MLRKESCAQQMNVDVASNFCAANYLSGVNLGFSFQVSGVSHEKPASICV